MRYRAEAFDIWEYFCDQIHNATVRCRIDFAGRIDEEALTRAVTLSEETIPMLGCCFEGNGHTPYWADKGFTGTDMVGVIEAGDDIEEEVLRAFAVRIDVESGPVMRMTIVRTSDADILCADISHLVCDAAGLKEYLALVSGIYTKLRRGERLPVQHAYSRGTKPLFTQTGMLEKARLLRTPIEPSGRALRDQPGLDFHSGETTAFMEYRVVPPEDFAAFKLALTSNGASINDGMTALYARAVAHGLGLSYATFDSTIDWRRFIPPDVPYGITNYAGNCKCDISVEPGDSVLDTVKQAAQQMRLYTEGKYVLGEALEWNLAVRFIPYTFWKKNFARLLPISPVTFSNIGTLVWSDMNFDSMPIRFAYMTGAIRPRPYLQLTISTFEGACTLACNIYGSQEERQFVDTLLGDIVREMSVFTEQSLVNGIFGASTIEE